MLVKKYAIGKQQPILTFNSESYSKQILKKYLILKCVKWHALKNDIYIFIYICIILTFNVYLPLQVSVANDCATVHVSKSNVTHLCHWVWRQNLKKMS